MTRKITLLLLVTFCALSHAQDELVLPYNATTLTEEQRALNPTYLAYPTAMADEIPAQQCGNYTPRPFTVNENGDQVYFSPGNLQYNAALGSHLCADGTTQPGTWRFAEHQYDFVGDATQGNVYWNGVKCDNLLISETYDGWVDLFCWATSGWKSGVYSAYYYQPYIAKVDISQYFWIADNFRLSMVEEYSSADWGVYNQIENYQIGIWRTLTRDEWYYIFNQRQSCDKLCGKATVNDVIGCIILPDNWTAPFDIIFSSGKETEYSANVYTLQQWELLENNGAVFIPATGYRYYSYSYYSDHIYIDANETGFYWSSTVNRNGDVQYLQMNKNNIIVRVGGTYADDNGDVRHIAKAVRLVKDVK